MKAEFLNEISILESSVNDSITEHSSIEEYNDIISILELLLSDCFDAKQKEYMNIMKNYYTNWYSGFTKTGEKHLSSILIGKVPLLRQMYKS